MAFTASEIRRLLDRLNELLRTDGTKGELYLVGGAVMCLAYNTRKSTKDLDGFFRPSRAIRTAAMKVASAAGLPNDWLNDAVKGFLSEKGDFSEFLELSNLRVMVATPQYLLAMKCLAMRLGAEFHDEEDVRFLIRYLNLTDYNAVLDIVTQYYPLERIPQKTLYALEEILEG